MATIEIFMQETGVVEFLLFLVAQVCMMAAAAFVGYMIGRHKYEETEVTWASRQHRSSQDGIEGRAGMEVKPLLLSGGHVAGNTEPYRADQVGRLQNSPVGGHEGNQAESPKNRP